MVLLETLILVVILLFLLYKWTSRNYHVFSERGIYHEKPKPFIGNIKLQAVLGKRSLFKDMIDQYLENKHHKVFGAYSFSEPFIVIADLELIKKVGIKDFDHFVNHKTFELSEREKVFGKHLLALRDLKWKEMRNTLTPSFTGSKMRLMHSLINECSIEAVNYLNEEIKKSGKAEIEVEMKDFFTRFTNDAIATVAFGIKVNSFKDKDNKFYKTGMSMTQLGRWMLVKAILFTLVPRIMKALRVRFIDGEIMSYFHDLVFDAVKYRQEHKIIRPDMIQLLLEARRNFEESNSTKTEGHATFDDEDLLAQCMIFFLAGFETVSTCLCFTLYELVVNPKVQEQLYEEIMEVEEQLEGKELNYETLTKMNYMNMVLCESLRKWPPAGLTDRVANDDYKLIDGNGDLICDLKKGDNIQIPIMALHYDPENFPEPEKFDPERFSKENEASIKPNSYLPFGIGPRSCIGNRLGLMETKSIVYHLVKNFIITPTEKTPDDMLKALKGFRMMPAEKFPMMITPRSIKEKA